MPLLLIHNIKFKKCIIRIVFIISFTLMLIGHLLASSALIAMVGVIYKLHNISINLNMFDVIFKSNSYIKEGVISIFILEILSIILLIIYLIKYKEFLIPYNKKRYFNDFKISYLSILISLILIILTSCIVYLIGVDSDFINAKIVLLSKGSISYLILHILSIIFIISGKVVKYKKETHLEKLNKKSNLNKGYKLT